MDQHGPLKQIKAVHPRELATELKRGRTLIDVRGASEWKGGHIPNAKHVPLGRVASEFAHHDQNKPLVLQCQGGTRSQIVLSVLAKLGYTDLLNLTGGFSEYAKSGLTIVIDK
jgi:hydroxyacylglutathione hydrolase